MSNVDIAICDIIESFVRDVEEDGKDIVLMRNGNAEKLEVEQFIITAVLKDFLALKRESLSAVQEIQ